MTPLLNRVGPFLIYSYTVILGLGILSATGLTGWLGKKDNIEKWFDAVIVVLVCGLFGSRLGFIWANWDYFQHHHDDIYKLWQGGYSYPGALIAAILGLWFWTEIGHKKSFPTYSDLLAPGFALLCAFGWLACWYEGCAYGSETIIGLFAADLPDEFGIFAVRYQTQFIGIIWCLLVFAFAMITRKRWHQGQLFWLTVGLISLGHVGISLLRGDPMPLVQSIRLDTTINGTFVLISTGFVVNYQNHINKS